MGIFSFFSKIGDGLKSIGNSIGNVFTSGYQEVKNVVSGTAKGIETEANTIVSSASNLANNVVKTGAGLIQHTEDSFKSIVSTPLLLIALGIGGLLLFNGKEVVQTAGTVAVRSM